MVTLSKASTVVGALGVVLSIPLTMLAGVALTNSGLVYAVFIISASLIIGVLASMWFQLISNMLGVSRANMCVAGALAAVTTALTFVLIFSVPASIVSRSGWFGTLMLYTFFTITTLLPILLLVGALVGLVASARRFAS